MLAVVLCCMTMKTDARDDVIWNMSPKTKTMATQATISAWFWITNSWLRNGGFLVFFFTMMAHWQLSQSPMTPKVPLLLTGSNTLLKPYRLLSLYALSWHQTTVNVTGNRRSRDRLAASDWVAQITWVEAVLWLAAGNCTGYGFLSSLSKQVELS